MTEKIDRFALNRYLGIPLFLAATWLMFKPTFDLSSFFADWLASLLTEGVIAGVGSVLACTVALVICQGGRLLGLGG